MPVDARWSEQFFNGPWIDLHLSMRGRSDIQRETDAIVALLKPGEAATIADVPCGPGDHCIELARRGFDVTGIDLSEELLEHARSRAHDARVDASFVAGDMRTYRSERAFDAVICLWGSYGYFDEAGDRAQLETLRQLLRPGGQLLLDMLPLEGILLSFEPHDSLRIGSMIVVQDRSYDMQSQRIDGTWTFHRSDERVERKTSMRLYTVREIISMLAEGGFTDVTLFDPETLGEFELGAIRTWVMARRV